MLHVTLVGHELTVLILHSIQWKRSTSQERCIYALGKWLDNAKNADLLVCSLFVVLMEKVLFSRKI
jgi:hypothetical protein